MSPSRETELSKKIPLQDIGRIIWRSRWLIVIVTATITVLAIVLTFVMTPIYKAEVRLIPVSQDERLASLSTFAGQLGGLASLAGISRGGGEDSVVSLAVLRSRSFAEDFIIDENLIPVLFASKWDASTDIWLESDPEKIPTIRDAYRRFDKTVREVSEDKRSHIVTLAIYWVDPVVAADWANVLVTRLNDRLRNQAMEEASNSIEFLNSELEAINYVGLRQGIYKLIESEIRKTMLANVRKEYAYRIIDPAVPMDPDMYEHPRRPLIIMLGFMVGMILGVVVAVAKNVVLEPSG